MIMQVFLAKLAHTIVREYEVGDEKKVTINMCDCRGYFETHINGLAKSKPFDLNTGLTNQHIRLGRPRSLLDIQHISQALCYGSVPVDVNLRVHSGL